MSGIAAVYHLDGRPVEGRLLQRMTEAIAHRGPDGMTQWRDGEVGLGHCMLHTTPESLTEKQPLGDETGDLWLTFDGRVDNRDELQRALEAAGYHLRTDTDAELVLGAYACWGADCPGRILGDFAFVVWDRRARQLVCARDILGLRPFYYRGDGRSFRCGSELQQILVDPSLPQAPNEGMIGEYLAFAITDTEETLFRDIFRLPPAHALIVRPQGIRKWRYWDGNLTREIRYRHDAEYAEHFRALFREAVRCRLRSHGPVAAELSGGLDSSSVVCTAQALIGKRAEPRSGPGLETFSLAFPGLPCDETVYIQDVVDKWRVTAHRLVPGPPDLTQPAALVRAWRDFPDYPNGMLFGSLRHLARERGCRTLLTGGGGDHWFTGSSFHLADLLRQGRIPAMLRRATDDVRLWGPPSIGPAVRSIVTYGLWPLVPESGRGLVRWALRRPAVPAWIQPGFAKRIELRERIGRGRILPPGRSLSQSDLYRQVANGFLVHVEEIDERQAARCGLELRHPFHDRRVVEFGLQIPEEQRRRGQFTKFVLRNAMASMLPESIRERRTKADFSHAFVQALQALGGETTFGVPTLDSFGWIDGARGRDLGRHIVDGSREGTTMHTASLWALWMLYGMELWVNTVFPEPGTPRVHAERDLAAPLIS